MSKLNEAEIKTILNIENFKRELTSEIDRAVNDLTYIRMREREWWKHIVKKYKLNSKKLHRIWIDGSILEERRRIKHERKIF